MPKLLTRSMACRNAELLRSFLGLLLLLLSLAANGQTTSIQAAPPGYIETGTPAFVVLGPEALGLNSAPIDLCQMPDGRILVFGHGELALGDGLRWEVFQQAANEPRVNTASVAVDTDGHIYVGVAGGFGRIEFTQDGRWRCLRVQNLPKDLDREPNILTTVSMVGTRWFWSWGSGPIIEWKPGGAAKTVGRLNALGRVFALGSTVCMSDQSNGTLYRLENGALTQIDWKFGNYVNQAITCSVPLADGTTLLGTIGLGLWRYDGTELRPFASSGSLAGEHRINDVCDIGYGLLAVALDNVGVVFIDQNGRIVQSLERSMDYRLARVKRLLRTPAGDLWALLNDGIVRINFPSRYSSFETMVTTGLAFSQPFRHEGMLWLMSDGKAQRGIYDDSHRLVRFEIDTPNSYLTSLVDLGGAWIATTQDGIFRREPSGGWTKLAEGPLSPHLRPVPVRPDCWLFAAEDEVGWLHRTGDQYTFERFPQPGMGHVYGAVADAYGVLWVELGTGKMARIEPTEPRPTVTVLGLAEGVHNSWAQLFLFEDEIRMNVNDQILRYDAKSNRFLPDADLARRVPVIVGAIGRPACDSQGRLWIAKPEKVLVVDLKAPLANGSSEAIPESLRPLYFTPQNDGVVWMNEPMRLVRFDPMLPAPEAPRLRAMITRVELPVSGLVQYPVGARIPAVQANDSLLVVHYLALNQPYGQSINFEFQLSGANGEWISTGNTGSITFNHLDPGAYQFRVRPRSGQQIGEDAHLDFLVLAPWYKTRFAYVAFGIGMLGAILSAIWLSAYFGRREKLRLEQLVSVRTGELNSSNRELEQQIKATTERTVALQASEERFRRLSDDAPDIIFRLRVAPDVGYDYVSPAVLPITGYRPEDFLLDASFTRKIIQPPGTATIYDDALCRQLPERVREIRWMARDGRILSLEERLLPVFDTDGTTLIAIEGVVRDFTERKRLEEQLRHVQRMDAVGQLAGGVAHDYNNILTATMMQLGALLAEPDLTEALRRSLNQLMEDAKRAASLTRQLLMFSRRQVVQIKPMDLNEGLADVLNMLRRLLGENVRLEFRPGSFPLWVNADAGMIEQVVTNLCVNARDAMSPKGGQLVIENQFIELKPDVVNANPEARPGSFVCLSVSDTGCGMDPVTLEHAFEPFYTTKDVGKGTGLGLATVYAIVKQHNGWVKAESQVGRGSIFRVYLPFLAGQKPIDKKLAKTETRIGTETILLVEDEGVVRHMLAQSLKRLGYRVVEAFDGVEAIKVWDRHADEIDLLFTDMRMPGGISGLELFQRLKQSKPTLKVIISSGYSEEILKIGVSANPFFVFLPKPYDMKTLADTVRRCLG